MPLLARRNKEQATSNKQQQNMRRFRQLFLESLDPRKLMASDLEAATNQDFLQRSLDPVQSASQPTANFSTFNSDRIVALDADSLNPRQAALIDDASRLSKNNYAPSAFLTRFQTRIPTQADLQGSLIGNSTTPRLELNASSNGSTSTPLDANNPETSAIANGLFFAGLFTPGVRSSTVRGLASAPTSITQWVGAFCDINGAEVFPQRESLTPSSPEGEGDGDDDPIVPEIDFPPLASSSHSGSLDSFVPTTQSNSSSLTTFGDFTAASLTNPDLTLPGLHWVHLVDVVWYSPTQWSFTESLVLSFKLGNSIEDEGDETDLIESEEDPSGGEDEDTGLDMDADWESSIGASRNGYFKFTFSASQGMTTSSAAGVRWSLFVDYLDSASVSAEASGSANFTPSDPPSGGGDVTDTPKYPDDFTASSKWQAAATIAVESSGVITVSSTPAFVSEGVIDRTVAASITYDVDGDIEISKEWSSSSQSGDITLVDFPVADADHPLAGFEMAPDAEADDVNDGEGDADDENWIVIDPADPSGRDPGPDPIGEIEGKGHASKSGGNSLNKAGGNINGSLGLNGVLRSGRFSSLIGSALSDLETQRASSGDGYHLFVFRDQVITPVTTEGLVRPEHGQTVATLVLTAGWKGKGKGDGSAVGDGDISLGLNSDQVPQASNASTGIVDGDSDSVGKDFVNLSFVETTTKNWDVHSEGLYGPMHHVGESVDSFELTYASRSKGKLIGDVYGFASLQDQSADFDSDLKGNGKSRLIVLTTHDYEEDVNWMNYTGPTLTQVDEEYSQREDYFSKYKITGNATGMKNDDGSVSWTLDAKILDYLDVDYDYFSLHTTTETNTLDFFSNRVATFDAAKATRSTVVGGGTISPQPGGDTGGLTVTESIARSGDTEVSITFSQTDTGEAATGLEIPVEKTELELELEAMFATEDEEAGESGGDTSGAGGGSYGDGTSSDGASSRGGWLPTLSDVWGVTSAGFRGAAQGACNIVNGVQDAAVGVVNVAIAIPNGVAGGIDYVTGVTDPHYQIRIPYVHSPDWSRNLVTEEGGTPGGWDDMHGWSKFAGGEGVMALITGGATKAASVVDEAGRCANWLTKFVRGGCFVAGTKVTVSELPYSAAREAAIWSDNSWLHDLHWLSSSESEQSQQIAVANRLLIPIEEVPLGARVPTKNPKPWEFDLSLPEPDQETWVKLTLTIERTDGGIVDAELIRPRTWVESNSIRAGQLLPLNIPELQVAGFAYVNTIEPCPLIAEGEGSVITARFSTRQVDLIARAEVLGADGSIEVIEGTTIHPIWSIDRNNWVELGELSVGEKLAGGAGIATVLKVAIVNRPCAVYNVEVHGEHVYQVGVLGALVHNTTETCLTYAKKVLSRRPEGVIISMEGKHGAIGMLPRYLEGAKSHYFHLQNGILRDDKFRKGIEISDWLKQYAALNKLPVSSILDDVFFQVFKW